MIRETVFIAVEDDGEEARILESAFRAERSWRLVCLENTHNFRGGVVRIEMADAGNRRERVASDGAGSVD